MSNPQCFITSVTSQFHILHVDIDGKTNHPQSFTLAAGQVGNGMFTFSFTLKEYDKINYIDTIIKHVEVDTGRVIDRSSKELI